MPYTGITLTQFVTQISYLLDDTSNRYWIVPEIQFAVFEALRVWGALTNYWRARGVFNLDPSSSTPYYDLSVQLPVLRSRNWTLNNMVLEIQYEILENPAGISGADMSGQTTIQAILNSIQTARNRFVLDTRLPLSVHSAFGNPPSPDGMITFNQSSVYVHRAAWQDIPSSTWTNLWREDAWSIDKNNIQWELQPGQPNSYSEAENSPLMLQLNPPPVNEGMVEALTVDSLVIDTTNPNSLFNIPDEWIHAVKYGALSELLSADSQINDPLRAQYAETRYTQAVEFARDARSIIRLMANRYALPLDSLAAIDAGMPYWRNNTGAPFVAGSLYDMIMVAPSPNQAYGIIADVVQSAPLPDLSGSTFIQLGNEELEEIKKYVVHYLLFKCGGDEFKSSMTGYDSFMKSVSGRKAINSAKIKYMVPLFGQPQSEWAMRPDKVMSNA